jgi:hypothetical protein
MTPRIASIVRSETQAGAPAGLPGVDPADGGGDPLSTSDELTRMIMAVGAVVQWRAAVYIEDRPAESPRSVVARSWTSEVGRVAPTVPDWVLRLDADSWTRQRIYWRISDPSSTRPCAHVAVPVMVEGTFMGTLVFVIAQLRVPDRSAIDLLEAVAAMIGRERGRSGGASATTDPDGTNARAIAMVDVFAYTVRVTGDNLQWRYFGPNSEVVFGRAIYPEESLLSLLESHAHVSDRGTVREMTDALLSGRPADAELRIVGLDGITRWISWRTVPRWADGALHVDGVATDVSRRHAFEPTRRTLEEAREGVIPAEDVREHAGAVLEANDNILQRIFAAGLRLKMLEQKVGVAEAHAVTAIRFQLDQAAEELREVIRGLDAVANRRAV